MGKILLLKNVTLLFTFLFLIWGCYRLIFKLPDEVEEIVVKPLIWIIPVLYLVKKEKTDLESIGITFKNLFKSIYISLILGSFFAFLAFITNYIKYGKFNFGANLGQEGLLLSFGLSFITAISEEIVFRGYIFTRLWTALNDEWEANLFSTIAWTLIHVPVTIFINKLDPLSTIIYLFLTFIYGMGSAYLYARTKNVASSIFLHVLWEWPIMLFR
jgi:membrane protease YdiL (CAAX protease family)